MKWDPANDVPGGFEACTVTGALGMFNGEPNGFWVSFSTSNTWKLVGFKMSVAQMNGSETRLVEPLVKHRGALWFLSVSL